MTKRNLELQQKIGMSNSLLSAAQIEGSTQQAQREQRSAESTTRAGKLMASASPEVQATISAMLAAGLPIEYVNATLEQDAADRAYTQPSETSSTLGVTVGNFGRKLSSYLSGKADKRDEAQAFEQNLKAIGNP